MTTLPFGEIQVLAAARLLVRAPLKNPCHAGPHCPYCAIAEAKGELDRRHRAGASLEDVLRDPCGNEMQPGDEPLVEAKRWLNEVGAGRVDRWGSAGEATRILGRALAAAQAAAEAGR